MTRRIFLASLFIVLFHFVGFSQEDVQWASEVLEVSSELTPIQYSAKQVLGKPDVFPNPGENPNAWTPSKPNKQEFIKVGFSSPMQVRQIMIGESYNPSAVSRVYAYDEAGNEYLINEFSPRFIDIQGRPLNLFFDLTDYNVAAVKIELNGSQIEGYHSIDAIGISASNEPIIVKVNVSSVINPDVETTRLSDNVNSEYSEFKPLLSPDGKTLFFSRKNHPENIGGEDDSEDIWYSTLNDQTGEWSEAKNAGPLLNNSAPNFISSITSDGNTMVVLLGNRYGDNGKMSSGVSVSTRDINGEWSKPQPITIENEYNFSQFASFAISDNREVLMMSVEREDTRGDRDLYVSFIKEDGSWTEPLNLGDDVNTAHEETAPFLATDNETLYFSSRGYSGFGGNDIYFTKRLDDTWTNWSEPENLGPGINSENDDEFFNIPPSGDNAYYSRGVSEDNLDIFSISMPTFYKPKPLLYVSGQFKDANTSQPIKGSILFKKDDGTDAGEVISDPDGKYKVDLPEGKYSFLASSEGYQSLSGTVSSGEAENQNVIREILLVPVVVEVKRDPFSGEPVQFGFDQYTLSNDSREQLGSLIKYMNTYQDVSVQILGYTDSSGPDSYNKGLSAKRAGAVREYLISNGVSEDRLSIQGEGEANPVADNSTREGRSKNRRVEIRVN